MSSFIRIKVVGDKQTIDHLNRIKGGLTDFRKPMTYIGEALKRYYSGQGFASQGGVFGAVWKPLSPAYAAWKAKNYPGRPPLVQTGEMRDNFTSEPHATHVILSNDSPYYKYHQSSAARHKLPRRQMAGINSDVKRIVQKFIHDDIHTKLRG